MTLELQFWYNIDIKRHQSSKRGIYVMLPEFKQLYDYMVLDTQDMTNEKEHYHTISQVSKQIYRKVKGRGYADRNNHCTTTNNYVVSILTVVTKYLMFTCAIDDFGGHYIAIDGIPGKFTQ